MNSRAYILLALTALFWGGNSIAGKFAVGHISPMMLNSARWLFAMLIILAIGLPQIKQDWHTLRSNWLLLFILGSVGFTGFTIALYSSLQYTQAINVSVEQASMPMLIFLLNFLFFRQRSTRAQLTGAAMAIIGTLLTASHGNLMRLLSLDLNLGDAIMLAGCLAYAAYTVALRYKPAVHWQSLMVALTCAGFVSSIPITALEVVAGRSIAPDMQGWLVLVYVVIFPSILSQIFYIRGVELIGANRAGLFINMVPVFGTILSVLILNEEFHLYHALSLALVFGGIWLAERRRPISPVSP